MTPAPRQQPKPNTVIRLLPYLFSTITFLAGYCIHSITVGEQVKELTETVNDMRGQLGTNQEKTMLFRETTGRRLDALEMKVFGRIQQPGFIAQANYITER